MTVPRRSLALVSMIVAALAALVVLALPAHAESISSINVAVTVNADTSMAIQETITYDFGSEERHGIYRDLVRYDTLDSGDNRYYDVSVEAVTQDGTPATYELLDEGRYLRVKIGDADTTITGSHTYVIDYTVRNGLRSITAADVADPAMPASVSEGDVELYWDLVGQAWEVPISDASGIITGPGAPLTAKCFQGGTGSTTTCPAAIAGDRVTVGGVPLAEFEGLTASVVYPRAAFSATPFEDVHGEVVSAGEWAFLAALPIAGLLTIVPAIAAIVLRRRDKGVDLNAAPPQYEPPDGLSPAEMAAAWKGEKSRSDSRVFAATLVDLAARGWVTLQTGDELVVTPTAGGRGELRAWERSFIDRLMPGGSAAVLQKYDSEHTETWKDAYDSLVAAAEQSGLRNPKGGKPDQRWKWLGLGGFLCVGLTFLSSFLVGGALAFLFPLGIGAIVGFFIARAITPRQETQQSAQFIAKVKGLERVLSTDPAAARRDLALRMGLPPVAVMATMLPFAIVFHLEKSWLGAFPDLTPADFATTGFGYLTIMQIDDLVDQTQSSTQAATMTQSSGSGGGGFSGGGGGGGGGGSW